MTVAYTRVLISPPSLSLPFYDLFIHTIRGGTHRTRSLIE